MTKDFLVFSNRAAFRAWLSSNVASPGIWLIFDKRKGTTLSAAEALEEALCFGWIDGQMESLDEDQYKKYFAPRRAQSKWSEKNRKLVEALEARGLMTDQGRKAIEIAKQRGTFEGEPRTAIADDQVNMLKDALRPYETALANFENMPPSARRAYTGGYFAVKTDAGREKKLLQLVERLNLNLNPMESLAKKKAELEKS